MAKSKKKDTKTAAAKENSEAPSRSSIRENFEAILVAVLFALFVRTFVAQAFQIPTSSMEDNLLIGDHLVVNKYVFSDSLDAFFLPSRDIKQFDVVIFKAPSSPAEDYVKRVIGMPGDSVTVRGTRVWVNNRQLDETGENGYRAWWKAGGVNDWGPATIKPGHYFVMGDNRDHSQDSRFWGPVPRDSIKGRPLFIYWSYESERNPHLGSLGQRAQRILDRFLHFFTKTRWDRTFKPIR